MLDFVLFIVATLIAFWAWDRHKKLKLRDTLGYKGPPVRFLTGNFHQVVQRNRKDRRNFMLMHEWIQQYGPVVGVYIGPTLFIGISDVDLCKQVFVKHFNNFVNRQDFPLTAKDDPMANSLLQLHGQQWKDVRSTVSPTFSTGKLRQMSPIIKSKVEILVEKLQERAKSGETFDIYDDFQGLSLDVIGKCAFAMDVDCQKNLSDPFYVNCRKWFSNSGIDASPLIMATCLLFPEFSFLTSKLKLFTKVGEAEKWLMGGLDKVVNDRATSYENFKSSDVLQLIMEQNIKNAERGRPVLSKEYMVGNCFAFLLAGYETTSTALGYTAWLLAKHPEVQKKLQNEITEFVNSNNKSEITIENVLSLPYLDAVFRESLRYLPPVIGFIARTCIKECEIDGFKFEPGMVAVCTVWTIHRSEEYWPEPDKYDPERFMGEKSYNANAWMPFGIGPRNCVGMRFAEIEYKMALLRVLERYNIQCGQSFEDPLKTIEQGVLMRPENGIKVKISFRK